MAFTIIVENAHQSTDDVIKITAFMALLKKNIALLHPYAFNIKVKGISPLEDILKFDILIRSNQII